MKIYGEVRNPRLSKPPIRSQLFQYCFLSSVLIGSIGSVFASAVPVAATVPALNIKALEQTSHSGSSDQKKRFATGLLDGFNGHPAIGAKILDHVAPLLAQENDPDAARAYEATAYDHAVMGDYAVAARAAHAGLAVPHATLSDFEVTLLGLQEEAWRVLSGQPLPIVTLGKPFVLKLQSNALGLALTDASVNGQAVHCFWDSGNDTLTMSQSMATRLKLKLLPGIAHNIGSGADKYPVRYAMVNKLQVGTAVFRYLPVAIAPDATLTVGPSAHQTRIDMIASYSMMRMLRLVTFTKDGDMMVGRRPSGKPQAVARLIEQRNIPVVLATHAGHEVNLMLDTGSDRSLLRHEYLLRYPHDAAASAGKFVATQGLGARSTVRQNLLSRFPLQLEHGSLVLKDVVVNPPGSAAAVWRQDGLIGRSDYTAFNQVTLDLARLRFELRR